MSEALPAPCHPPGPADRPPLPQPETSPRRTTPLGSVDLPRLRNDDANDDRGDEEHNPNDDSDELITQGQAGWSTVLILNVIEHKAEHKGHDRETTENEAKYFHETDPVLTRIHAE
jgi:hypothetical protein